MGVVSYGVDQKLNQITLSSKKNIKMVEIDLQKQTKITGFVAKGIQSFQLYFKKRSRNKKFIPYLSDETGKIMSFSLSGSEIYLPFEKKLTVRQLQLRNIKFKQGSEANID